MKNLNANMTKKELEKIWCKNNADAPQMKSEYPCTSMDALAPDMQLLSEALTQSSVMATGLVLPKGYEFRDENGNVINTSKIVLEKKKNEYPKTYEECAKVLLDRASVRNDLGYKGELLVALQKLLVCRDAYWQIAGQKMGLDNPWEPDYNGTFEDGTPIKYVIYNNGTYIVKERRSSPNYILAFPTEEMRDEFYENFIDLIEECKELL